MERAFEAIANPSRSLHDLLRQYVNEALTPVDYSYRRPNRRNMQAGFITPGVRRENIGEMVLVIDNSGSIDQHALSVFNLTVKSIIEDLNPRLVHIMYCDTHVNDYHTCEPGDMPNLNSHGGGGTDFRPPFLKVTELGITPLVLVYFTDMESSYFPDIPSYATIWVRWGNGGMPAPFGTLVDLGREH